MSDVTPQDRLKALETMGELAAMYSHHRSELLRRSEEATDYQLSKDLFNEAEGAAVVLEKLERVRAVIEDAVNRRKRRPKRQDQG